MRAEIGHSHSQPLRPPGAAAALFPAGHKAFVWHKYPPDDYPGQGLGMPGSAPGRRRIATALAPLYMGRDVT
jgi:hypothetical protein